MLDPKNKNSKKTSFCISSYKLFLKYDQHTCHWVGHYLRKTISTDEFTKNKEYKERKNHKEKPSDTNVDMKNVDEVGYESED